VSDLSGVSTVDLELYLKFDGNYNDDSGNARHQSTAIGAPTFVPGIIDDAARFNLHQGNYIDTGVTSLGDASLFPGPGEEWTFACWIKFAGATANGAGTIISRQRGTGTAGLQDSNIFIHVPSTQNRIIVRLRGADRTYNLPTHDGNWHHIALTWDGTTPRFYFDGSLQATPLVGGNIENATPIWIGASKLDVTKTPSSHLIGDVDDLRVYSRVLSPTEIAILYGFGSGDTIDVISLANLELWLKYDNNFLDSSVNERHQTANVNGTPDFVAGKIDEACRFKGNVDEDRIETGVTAFGDCNLFPGAGFAWTVIGWVYVDPALGFLANRAVVSKWRVSPVGARDFMMRVIRQSTGTLCNFQLANRDNTTGTTFNGVMEVGKWHHVAAVWDGTDLKAYVDGVHLGNVTLGTASGPTSWDITIAAQQQATGSYVAHWFGLQDDLRFYSRALSDAEIGVLFSDSGMFTAILDVIGFDEGVATVRATFGAVVPTLLAGDITVTNGTVDDITDVEGNVWTFTVTPVEDGIVSVQIEAGAVEDAEENTNSASNILQYGIGGFTDPGDSGLARFDRTGERSFAAYLIIGPFPIAPNLHQKALVQRSLITLGSPTNATGTFQFVGGVDGEDAVIRAENEAGQYEVSVASLQDNNGVSYPRVAGSAMALRIDTEAGHLVYEGCSILVKPAGMNRLGRFVPPVEEEEE
jgi:hypothetical protein